MRLSSVTSGPTGSLLPSAASVVGALVDLLDKVEQEGDLYKLLRVLYAPLRLGPRGESGAPPTRAAWG